MSLALYRKYRPATFAELKGQEHVAEPLRQALRNGRINHAYLFSGPRGCGKTSSARILARSLICEQGPTPDPCGECDSCVALGPGGTGHIDVIEIDAASHGGVDDARDLRERAFFTPVSARFKVYIIDEAHMVTQGGFNALLKLVEEPPPHLKFVFATTEPEKVIGTIRSRTHHYPFRLIPPGVLQELVEEILDSENVPYEEAALPLAVRAGAGSARDTLSILDQLLAGSDERGITYARAVALLGYTDSALLDEVVAAFAARDGAAVFTAVDRVIESGQDPRRFTADLLERVRDLVILSNVPEAGGSGLFNVAPDELERMRRQAGSMGPGELTRAADLLHTGLTEMRGATSPRLLLELICARILLPAAYEDEASLFARLDRLERQASQGGFGGGQGLAGAIVPVAGDPAPAMASPRQPSEPARRAPQAADRPVQAGDPAHAAQGAGEGAGRPDGQGTGRDRDAAGGARGDARAGRPGEAGSGADGESPANTPGRASGQGGDPGGRPGQSGQGGHASSSQRGVPSVDRPAERPEAERGSVDNGAARSAPQAGGHDVGAVQRAWPDIVEAVKQKSRATWMVIMSGVRPLSLEGRVLTLQFDSEGSRLGFVNGNRDVILCEVLKEGMGVDWRIETVSGGGSGAGGRAGGGSRANPGGRGAGGSAPSGGFGSSGGLGSGSSGGFGSGAGPSGGFGGAATATVQDVRPDPAPMPRPPADPVPPPDEPPPPPEPDPVDESEEVDPEGDADADGSEAEMTGMALIQRELGGQIIREIDNS
ncbi:DNA polymerase III subunit gamma and tau [Spirillospora albida]|uniref:DNA polymerase III subunit gamma and tau n=1 Tax=Spirillospora albida TaxID=58123 RepID=UPI0004BFC609|nr:DNA polymerase III subunit gamma and tau [Spirillospora albida]